MIFAPALAGAFPVLLVQAAELPPSSGRPFTVSEMLPAGLNIVFLFGLIPLQQISEVLSIKHARYKTLTIIPQTLLWNNC